MNEEVEVVLYGTPTPKGRPRFTRTGRTYTDAKTRAAEQSILSAWLAVAKNRLPHDGPITLLLEATFVPPPSWPKWKRELALAGDYPHTTKPDFDNLAKVIDGLNGRAWLDDSQICDARTLKKYGETASTRLVVTFHPSPPERKPTK
jgi:Holliday junction resolvase RusA-like endonuclease